MDGQRKTPARMPGRGQGTADCLLGFLVSALHRAAQTAGDDASRLRQHFGRDHGIPALPRAAA